jgi:hypothetical protein
VSHSAEFVCAECGAVAGRVEVVPSPVAADRSRLVLSVFHGMWEELSRDGAYADAIAAIDAHDARALWKGSLEWAPFYCPECDACYCREHWRTWLEFDEGFCDREDGLCPRGHLRMIQD